MQKNSYTGQPPMIAAILDVMSVIVGGLGSTTNEAERTRLCQPPSMIEPFGYQDEAAFWIDDSVCSLVF